MNEDTYRKIEAELKTDAPEHADTAALLDRVKELERRVLELENPKRLGPQLETKEERAAQDKVVEDFIKNAKKQFKDMEGVRLADHPARMLVSGEPVPDDYSHTEINPTTGMQKDYIVLTPEERSKGFVRPVRRAYKHLKCGAITTMALSIAQTFARDPGFYSGGGYCATCKSHFENKEFVWPDDATQVGS